MKDLKDLGVILGDRRKMLFAIGELAAVSLAGTILTPGSASWKNPLSCVPRQIASPLQVV
jgi:hypothetical protein